MKNVYQVPAKDESVQIEIKKSRFIAYGHYVTEREQAMDFLVKLKAQYPDARHHCWAYLLGNPTLASNAGMNDDGEPSGTAGKPILNVIQHKKIGDIIVVVVRYFGGIKLGTGGLTRAYSSAAEALLSSIELTEHVPMINARLTMGFSQENKVRHWLTLHNGRIISIAYQAQDVVAEVVLPELAGEAFLLLCQQGNINVDFYD